MKPKTNDIEAGNEVTLKGTTSPIMAVEKVTGKDAACVWFDTHGAFQRETIGIAALEVKPAAEPGPTT
jgi:hypothetical protein